MFMEITVMVRGLPPTDLLVIYESCEDNNNYYSHPNKVTKMQLDVGVSPPANIMTFRPGLTHFTFDLDPCDLSHSPMTLDLVHYL